MEIYLNINFILNLMIICHPLNLLFSFIILSCRSNFETHPLIWGKGMWIRKFSFQILKKLIKSTQVKIYRIYIQRLLTIAVWKLIYLLIRHSYCHFAYLWETKCHKIDSNRLAQLLYFDSRVRSCFLLSLNCTWRFKRYNSLKSFFYKKFREISPWKK